MNKENINRLKKYLFLISIFFSFLIWGHVIYVYLYNDALQTPIEGGSISEWIIGDFPHLNPLLNTSDYNKNVIYKLYRSVLKYDFENKKLIWDIATCDIKNLSYIECYIENNTKWSNGKDITSEDIVGTYNIIKNSDINPLMSSLLKETVINSKPGVVTFSNKVKDINFLQVFLQPIVSKELLDNIGNKELFGKFNPIDGIYSWPYKIETVSYDDSLGIQKLILIKNEFYTKEKVLIAKYIYKIFRDSDHFLKHKDVINVFYDKNNIIGNTIARLEKKPYTLNKYMSIFVNEENIKSYNLRSFLISKIDTNNILKNLWSGYQEVQNPYLIDGENPKIEIQNLNLENTIQEMGFYKKDFLLANINQETKKREDDAQSKMKVNANLNYISQPINTKYSFLNEDNILISWNTKDNKIEEIYINDYKLSSFKKGETDFYYRLKTEFKNLTPWENNYKLYFVVNGKKELKEEFTIVFSRDNEKLQKIKDQFFSIDTSLIVESSESDLLKQKQIADLEDKYYYDNNLKKFILKLYYIDDITELIGVSNTIKNILHTYGIVVDTIPISLADLNKKIIGNEKDYDILLVGIDLWVFNFNIFPYFHSSQSKWGFNFSNVKNLNLDILLEELKTNIYDEEKRLEIQKKVIHLISEKQIFKALYKKQNYLLIDKNIKNFTMSPHFYSDIAISEFLAKSYVSEDKKINFQKKNFYDFLDFIITVFKNEW